MAPATGTCSSNRNIIRRLQARAAHLVSIVASSLPATGYGSEVSTSCPGMNGGYTNRGNVLAREIVVPVIQRDETGKVVGLDYSNPAMRHVQFTRLSEAQKGKRERRQ